MRDNWSKYIFYILDDDSGQFWLPKPTCKLIQDYECCHGTGHTVISGKSHDIESRLPLRVRQAVHRNEDRPEARYFLGEQSPLGLVGSERTPVGYESDQKTTVTHLLGVRPTHAGLKVEPMILGS